MPFADLQVVEVLAGFRKSLEQLQALLPRRLGRFLVAETAFGISQVVQPDRFALFIQKFFVRSCFRQMNHIFIASQESERLQSRDDRILLGWWIVDDLIGELMRVVAASREEIQLRQGGFGEAVIGEHSPRLFDSGDGFLREAALEVGNRHVVASRRKVGRLGEQVLALRDAIRVLPALQQRQRLLVQAAPV